MDKNRMLGCSILWWLVSVIVSAVCGFDVLVFFGVMLVGAIAALFVFSVFLIFGKVKIFKD